MGYEGRLDDGGKRASQAYWNALKMLRVAWKKVSKDEIELPTHSNGAKASYQLALDIITRRLEGNSKQDQQFREFLDVGDRESITEALLGGNAYMDDVTPWQVKQEIYEQALQLGSGRHELNTLLRRVLDNIFTKKGMRKPRVGQNRHWPRLYQYIRELEEETERNGMRLVNAGGRGPIANNPSDPNRLAIWIDSEYL